MRTFFLALMLTFSFPAWAVTVSNSAVVPSITVGGRVFTDLTNLKILYTEAGNNNGAVTYAPFVNPDGTNYQVTTGKTFTIYAIRFFNFVVGAATSLRLGYGTTAAAFSTSAPTGATNLLLAANFFPFFNQANTWFEMALNLAVPATKFPYLVGPNSATTTDGVYQIFGYEK